MSYASYGFFSVLRRGLAARIPAAAPSGPRVDVTASFSVGGQAVTGLPTVALRGPGDIIGFDGSAVSRTWPTANDLTAEPNYFAVAEIRDADFPWRYTPAASTGDRLTPWLCLIVVKDSEITPLVPAGNDRPLATLTVNDAGALPDLSQAWAWAHTQLAGSPTAPATDFNAAAVSSLLASSPELFLSRLIGPRKLDPQTPYLACVVPTFELGRLAGLGLPPGTVDRMTAAWSAGAAPVTLPVYYSWRFTTGQAGDFASLVHLLVARHDLPSTVWQRDLAVSAPGAQPPAWQVVGLEGALRTLDAQEQAWGALDAHGFSDALVPLVNGLSPTVLGPPLYGRWLAATAALSTAATATPPWFHQLNGDPRARVAAGLGTLVVQAEQEDLLAQAWTQADGIRRINNTLRLTQIARELATRLHDMHFVVAGDGFLQLTAPLHAHVRDGATTALAPLLASAISSGAIGAAWRRLARPLGSLGVRQGRPTRVLPTLANGTLARLNSGALAVVPAVNPAAVDSPRLGDLATTFANAGVHPSQLGTVALPSSFNVKLATRVPVTTLTTTVVAAPTTTATTTPIAATPSGFAQAAAVLMQQLSAALPSGVQWLPADLAGMSQTIAAALHPKQTIEGRLAAQLTGVIAAPGRTDPIEPVMAAPNFPEPLYQGLRTQSQAWVIPGLDQVPPNTVATLTTNWPFVEAFLVGANHEMARKLLWNGFPTDQRSTYFRYFWDMRGRDDGNLVGDIGPITQWTGALGNNRPTPTDPLVLLVRGELIRRYPNVIVYAAAGVLVNKVRAPGTPEKQPLFSARLDPDVALFGFDLDSNTARANPGWYFVLQEHPSEPRFGLDAAGSAWGAQPSSWDALGWDHLVADAAALVSLRYVDLNAALPQNPPAPDPSDTVWHAGGTPGSRSADLAHITFRRPQRLAIHASMLLPSAP